MERPAPTPKAVRSNRIGRTSLSRYSERNSGFFATIFGDKSRKENLASAVASIRTPRMIEENKKRTAGLGCSFAYKSPSTGLLFHSESACSVKWAERS